jgi:hypothetical protein
MTRVAIIIILAIVYVTGLHALTARAQAEAAYVASFYTAASNPQSLFSASSK